MTKCTSVGNSGGEVLPEPSLIPDDIYCWLPRYPRIQEVWDLQHAKYALEAAFLLHSAARKSRGPGTQSIYACNLLRAHCPQDSNVMVAQ